jgi:hypothetical protein
MTDEKLMCESCGEVEQEVHAEHAGLCGECYGATVAESNACDHW